MLIGKKNNVRVERKINIKIRKVVCDLVWESVSYDVRRTVKTPTWDSLWNSVCEKSLISIWK